MSVLQQWFEQIKDFLDIPLLKMGGTQLTLWSLVYLMALLILLFYVTGKIRNWIANQLLARSKVEVGVRHAFASIARYILVTIGLVVILQTVGIDLSALTILAGALGIGVGFGLQNITNNLVSGLIILFERPIKVGDRIEVGNITGDVIRISPRATTIVTNDNITIIVPNSEFISSRVTNWSHTDRDVRFNFPVGVSYKEKPEIVRGLLLEVAADHPGVLKQPKPDVMLQEFGESSLNFVLRIWTRDYTTRPGVLRSELNYNIVKKFREHGIEIPFPQRDLHIRTGAIELRSNT